MSEKFVASNGVEISRCGRGVYDDKGRRNISMSDSEVAALREFFLHERDTELGRWRWPENPDYVVYPVGNVLVDVLRESSATKTLLGPGRLQGVSQKLAGDCRADAARHFYDAATGYFEAHPEPKPWHDAKPGEVWVVENLDGEYAYTVDPEQFYDSTRDYGLDLTDKGITRARRIWPEVVSDDS
ncbi:hypothetical protein MUN76_15180 [Leucobacter rhizosphaerae]|uniref:Uncharacterized protein n=1 Tax=Leucobacter rhizosphaerae TaxID=2932245 RepID=A0ABY4FVN4_9MICO|nr:hypothetical protein [Leucobacter rhizosphaerae]UOQ60352.1 hypothetical protein MUN76_15180 [Leucobacter rhizosphaerae]